MRQTNEVLPGEEVEDGGGRLFAWISVWVVFITILLGLGGTLLIEHKISFGIAIAAEK